MTIIAFSGLKGSGKTTAAQLLQDKGYVKLSFARPLKDIVAKAFDLDFNNLSNLEAKEASASLVLTKGKLLNLLEIASRDYLYIEEDVIMRAINACPVTTFANTRQLLQFVGSEVFRDLISKNYWTDCFKQNLQPFGKYTCDDARFPNEADVIKQYGGRIVLINRAGQVKTDTHQSEALDFPVDYSTLNSDLGLFKQDIETIRQLIESGRG